MLGAMDGKHGGVYVEYVSLLLLDKSIHYCMKSNR